MLLGPSEFVAGELYAGNVVPSLDSPAGSVAPCCFHCHVQCDFSVNWLRMKHVGSLIKKKIMHS